MVRRPVGVLFVLLSIAATPASGGSAATAANDWTIVASPNVSDAQKANFLSAVACVSASDCWTVGQSQTFELVGSVPQTLVERWDGTSWAIVPSPNSSPTQSNTLTGVACVSASDCWAVGSYIAGGTARTLIEHWDGTSWAIVPSPNTSDTQSNTLNGVTCASTSACFAVGHQSAGGVNQTLVERWDGTSWAIVPSPNSSPTQANSLAGVTCASASDCWAVGSSSAGSSVSTLIEHWNGTSWSIVASANAVPVQFNFLRSVTCASPSDCWAVGHYIAASTVQTLIEHWDGTSWTIAVSSNIGDAQTTNELHGVTCRSASDCWAVGIYRTANSPFRTLVQRWNGTSWAVVPSPNSGATHDNHLNGVACVSGSQCLAVGAFHDGSIFGTLVEGWNGTSWTVVPSPNSRATETTNALSATTCLAPSDCWAVGYTWTGTLYRTLIEHWDGAAWAIVSSPNASARSNSLSGLTCVSASDCWAIGSYQDGTTSQALILRWGGSSWAVVPSPTIPTGTSLTGVDCVSASDCWAVGLYLGGTTAQTLILRWDGSSWAIVLSPNTRPAQTNSLTGVTCVSASACWAVGHYQGTTFQTLILRWDGSSWTIVTSPNTSATLANLLRGVSCVSASLCWAAGYAVAGSVYQTLVLRWDGAAWTIVPSANTSTAQNNHLFGVTCASASACWAVGYVIAGGAFQTLIEGWDGTSWTLDAAPNTSVTKSNVLYGVACPSQSACWATGYHHTGTVYQTLTIKYAAEPTAVGATDITARRIGRTVVVRWRGTHPGVLGFHVFRARIRLTPRLIEARAAGRSYRFVDRRAPRGPIRYRIQVVRTDGSTAWAGSVVAWH